MTTIYLLRHAHTTASPAYAPEFDWPLDEAGLAQAAALVDVLTPLQIDAIHTSPQHRAVQTVEPFATAAGIEPQRDPALSECNFNRVWQTDFRALVRRHWEDRSYAGEGCESHGACQSRFVAALRRIADAAPDATILCCTGGQAIALTFDALDPGTGMDAWSRLRFPDLFCLHADGGSLVRDHDFEFAGV